MIVVCAKSYGVAERIGEQFDGARRYFFNGVQLFAAVRRWLPAAALVHVDAGGHLARAVDWAPFLHAISPSTEIVLLNHSPTAGDVRELNGRGVYTYANMDDAGWGNRLRDVLTQLSRRPASASSPRLVLLR